MRKQNKPHSLVVTFSKQCTDLKHENWWEQSRKVGNKTSWNSLTLMNTLYRWALQFLFWAFWKNITTTEEKEQQVRCGEIKATLIVDESAGAGEEN